MMIGHDRVVICFRDSNDCHNDFLSRRYFPALVICANLARIFRNAFFAENTSSQFGMRSTSSQVGTRCTFHFCPTWGEAESVEAVLRTLNFFVRCDVDGNCPGRVIVNILFIVPILANFASSWRKVMNSKMFSARWTFLSDVHFVQLLDNLSGSYKPVASRRTFLSAVP